MPKTPVWYAPFPDMAELQDALIQDLKASNTEMAIKLLPFDLPFPAAASLKMNAVSIILQGVLSIMASKERKKSRLRPL